MGYFLIIKEVFVFVFLLFVVVEFGIVNGFILYL